MLTDKNIILSAVCEAGEAILSLAHHELFIQEKENKDIVTEADLLANNILKERLFGMYRHAYWLSEENQTLSKNVNAEYIWIVDPIDGTKEFVAGIPEYAISLALIKNHLPQFAVVFNPVTQELFYAIKEGGSYLNNKKIICRQMKGNISDLLLLVSRTEYNRGEWDFFSACQIKPVGSIAYKMALVAAGIADATLTSKPRHIWDIAAGALLITEAQGQVTNAHKESFSFDGNHLKIEGILAGSQSAWPHILNWGDRFQDVINP